MLTNARLTLVSTPVTRQVSRSRTHLQHVVVWRVIVRQRLDVFEEDTKLGRQVLEEGGVVLLVLHDAHLLLVLHLAPRQLAGHELDEHVEERPQVIVSAHLLQRPVSVELCTKSLQFRISLLTLFLWALIDA